MRTRNNRPYSQCKFCCSQLNAQHIKDSRKVEFSDAWFLRRYYRLKSNAAVRGIEFDLSLHEFKKLRERGGSCIYCKRNNVMFSIDRKNNDLGYISENCVLSCLRCNLLRSNHFSYEEMVLLSKTIRKIDALRMNISLNL